MQHNAKHNTMQHNTKHQSKQSVKGLNYVLFPLDLLDIAGMTSGTALVYIYMLNRSKFFAAAGNDYFESQSSIAEATRQSEATVKRAVKYLLQEHFIAVRKMKSKTGWSNHYEVVDLDGVLKQKQQRQQDCNDLAKDDYDDVSEPNFF